MQKEDAYNEEPEDHEQMMEHEEPEDENGDLNEEEKIFKEIVEKNRQRIQLERNGQYIEAGRVKEALSELGAYYNAKCRDMLEIRQR